MKFPLDLTFKVVALAPQVTVTDMEGKTVCYVRQKMMRLKESVDVYTQKKDGEKICEIRANKVIDFSATYHFLDNSGRTFGAVQRKGMRSLWKAHYEILDPTNPIMLIREENPWIKVVDSLVGEIPVIGIASGFLFHPSYLVSRMASQTPLVRITKAPALFESKFHIEKLSEFDQQDETRIVISTLMMVLLERDRG